MDNVNKIFEELKNLMGKSDAESAARRDEIALWIKENGDKPEVQKAYNEFMNTGLKSIEDDVDGLAAFVLV